MEKKGIKECCQTRIRQPLPPRAEAGIRLMAGGLVVGGAGVVGEAGSHVVGRRQHKTHAHALRSLHFPSRDRPQPIDAWQHHVAQATAGREPNGGSGRGGGSAEVVLGCSVPHPALSRKNRPRSPGTRRRVIRARVPRNRRQPP